MTHRAQERAVVAAGVAHEIKNPLEGIYGAAQLLQEEGKGNSRFIQMILKDSVRLNETVQQFLRFSRPFSAHLNHFDVVQFCRAFCEEQNEIASCVKPVGHTNHESIPLDFASSHPEFMVHSDEEGLRQILLNLVQNAKRYQPHGIPVRVVADVREEVIEIRVQDEGEGVPETQRAKLFEPFFTTSTRGTGLGLAISRKIARELGGDLYYEPANPGTHFVLVVRNHPGTEGGST
jgi:two-component system, sporulation sensor kinase A